MAHPPGSWLASAVSASATFHHGGFPAGDVPRLPRWESKPPGVVSWDMMGVMVVMKRYLWFVLAYYENL